jgi:hypothetical protein
VSVADRSAVQKRRDAAEMAGFGCAVAAFACLGWWLGGPLLGAALGLVVLAAALILIGNS